MKTKSSLLTLTLAFLTLASPAFAGLYTADYLGGGIWEQDGGWSTNAYPHNGHIVIVNGNPYPDNNPTYNATINNPTTCTLGTSVRIEAVNVFSGSTLNLGSGGYLWANTGFGNAGLITLNSTGNFSGLLRSGGDSNVVAGGEIFMSDNGSNSVTAGAPDKVLTIAAGGRIRGAGSINAYHGDDIRTFFHIVNHGLIEAMQPVNPLRIFLTTANAAFTNSMVNDGTLRASGQGVLSISNFNNPFYILLNQGGTIEAIDNGTVRVRSGSTITGGTLVTSGGGTIRGDDFATVGGGGIFKDVLNKGTMAVGPGETLSLAGTYTSDGGLLRIDGSAPASSGVFVRGEVALTGNGLITLSGSSAIASPPESPGQTLIVNSGITIRGDGQIGDPNGSFVYRPLNLVNHGLIEATTGMTIFLFRGLNSNVANDGTIRANSGASYLQFNGPGSVVNNSGGIIQALGSSDLLFTGDAILTNNAGGTIDFNGGTLRVDSGMDLNGGTLRGHGTIQGDVRNNGGIFSPGHSPGKITINGNYIQGANGTLNMEIGGTAPGTEYDQLVVNGNAALDGTLNLTLINGFRPRVGDVFQLIVPNTSSGSFSTVNTTGFTGTVDFSSNGITVTVTTVPEVPLNISTRLNVGTDPNQLIGGFTITGSEAKKVIILATGPSLEKFHLPGLLEDPILELYQGNTLIASNDNWEDPDKAEIEATGFQPGHKLESALVRTLPPGGYTAVVRGTNGTGVGTVQIYDLAETSKSKLANIAARGVVETPDDRILIGGFIIGGNGGADARVIVRALGPSLSAFQIAGALPDPTLELKNSNGSTLGTNDDWDQSPDAAEISARSLAPGDHESALVASLPNGGYTAIVRGKNGETGVAVVEVYNVE